jgi:hypothetical protein
MVVPVLANRVYNMTGNNLYDSSVESYGTIKGTGVRNIGRPKVSTAAKIAPVVFLVVIIGLACLSTVIQKDEKQVDQVSTNLECLPTMAPL